MKFTVAASLIALQFASCNALTISIPSISDVPFLNGFNSHKNSHQIHNHAAKTEVNCNSSSVAKRSSVAQGSSSVAAASSTSVASATVNSTASASISAVSKETSSAQTNTGRGTFYQPSNDACGTSSSAQDMIVAISQQLYESNNLSGEYISGYCGKYITANYQGKSVKVKVVDACASCSSNDLDFSPAAFQQLADPEIGVIQVTWNWD